jgi:hypothetical protein
MITEMRANGTYAAITQIRRVFQKKEPTDSNYTPSHRENVNKVKSQQQAGSPLI